MAMTTNGTTYLDTVPMLRRTGLKNFLTEGQLKDLERFCRPSARKAGTTLFRQDEPADAVYFVVEGSVELRARPPGRRIYRTVEVVRSSCTFGDEALFAYEKYLVSARVLESARLCSLSRSAFERLTDNRPDIAAGVLRCSGSCLMQTVRRAAILTQSPADVGLKTLLRELATDHDQRVGRSAPIRITHAQLAGVLHLSRETVSRMLSQMAGEGWIELGRGLIRVQLSSDR
jgi:CRP/FNR family cyclic AMP-dependent transcriptional regulator